IRAGRRGWCGRRAAPGHQLHQVQLALLQPRLDVAAGQLDLRDVDGTLRHIDTRAVDFDARDVDVMLRGALGLHAQLGHGDAAEADVDLQRTTVGARDLVVTLDVDDARVQLEGHAVSQVTPHRVRLESGDLECSARGEWRGMQRAVPGEALALGRGGVQRI